MDINKQNMIYFYSPNGTWTRINKNLEYLGLDENKKVGNTYTRDFSLEVRNNTFMEKYKDYDILFLDEFYDFAFGDPDCFRAGYEAMKKLISAGKQIVMAGHERFDNLKFLPEEMIKEVALYDLNYDLDWDYNYKADCYIDYD